MAKTKSKRNLSERLIKKTAKSKSVNPFDVRINRQKFEVLGRKSKNDRGLPGVARAKSIKKRKETLLQEYKVKDKVNKFLDRRIGENNSAMTQEDKIMARYTAERIKSHNKKTLFNLADDEVLTHRGKTLSEIEKYDDPGSEDEEEFEEKGGGLEADIVESHFGGGIFREKEDGAKTHATLIDELIAESKKRKAERQRAKEQTLELTDKLDAEWHELLPIVGPGKAIDDVEQKPEKGSYDQLMRELKFESRGVPSDRLKSADEVAKEEKEKLEKLEEERLKRMKGLDEVSTAVPKHRSADDLDDGFEIDDEIDDDNPQDSTTKSEEVATSSEDSEQDDDDDEDEEEEEEECEDGTKDDEEQKTEPKNQLPIGIEKNVEDKNTMFENEESKCDNDDEEVEKDDIEDDDDDDLSDLKHNSDDDNDDADVCKDNLKPVKEDGLSQSKDLKVHPNEKIDNKKFMDALIVKKQQMEDARKELPYTFELPESYEELERIMEGRSVDQQGVIVERIIKCHHPSLGDNNKLNLEKLFTFLLQLLNDADDEDVWKLLDRLAPHLFDLTQFSPENSAHCLLEVLNEKHEDFKKLPFKFPETNTLVFLKLVPLLFPSSDVRHRVTTPAFVFLLQILNQCKVRCRKTISKGLFVVTMLLEYTALSNKYSPETVNFLQGVLEMAVSGEPVSLTTCKTDWNVLVMDSSNESKNYESNKLSYVDLTAKDVPIDDNFRLSTLYTLIRLLSVLCSQLENIPSFKIIFSRIRGLLKKLEVSKYPSSLRGEISNLQTNVNNIFNRKLQFVVLEKKKPKALRLYEPQIVKVFEGRKRKDIPEEKAEQQKLLAKYKKEMKGALREIRRDNAFLTKVKLQHQARSDEDRRRKVKQIYSWGAAQEGEFNKLKRRKKH